MAREPSGPARNGKRAVQAAALSDEDSDDDDLTWRCISEENHALPRPSDEGAGTSGHGTTTTLTLTLPLPLTLTLTLTLTTTATTATTLLLLLLQLLLGVLLKQVWLRPKHPRAVCLSYNMPEAQLQAAH